MRTRIGIVGVVAALSLFGVSTPDAGNMESGYHDVLDGSEPITVYTFPNEDACMRNGQGSTVGILDGVHQCSEPVSCHWCLTVGR